MNHKLFIITVLLLLMVGVTIGQSYLAQADTGFYTAHWNSTADWNAGTKENVSSATDSCLASGQGIQLKENGGNYGVSQRCPNGTPIPETVLNSWSGRNPITVGGVSMLRDYGSADNAMVLSHVNNITDGPFGGGVFLNTNPNMVTAAPISHGISLSMITLFVWVKTNSSGNCGSGLCMLFNLGTGGGFIETYWGDSSFSSTIVYQYGGGTPSSVNLGTLLNDGQWHGVAIRANYSTGKVQSYVDGVPSNIATMNSPYIPNSNLALYVGTYQGYFFQARNSFSDFGIIYGWANNSEMREITSVGTYQTLGDWISPAVHVTNTYPSAVVLGFANVSAGHSYFLGFDIMLNSTSNFVYVNNTFFDTGTANVSYLNGAFPVYRGNSTWYLEVDFAQSYPANSTPVLTYAAMVFTQFGPLPAAVKTNPTLDATAITLILLILVWLFLFIVGFFERFAMVGAAIASAIIAILSFTWTGTIFVPALFILAMAVNIGLAITKHPDSK